METEEINIKIKNIHPLRELEICLENSFPNCLQFYFKKINYIIKCESDEKRREIKADLEKKRNEIMKALFTSVKSNSLYILNKSFIIMQYFLLNILH